MRWLALVMAVLAMSALALALLKRRSRPGADRGAASPVGSYDDIKRRIRYAEAMAPAPAEPSPRPPPRPLDEIFRLPQPEFLPALVESVAARAARVGEARLGVSEAALLDVWTLEGEVNNGGFDQYFFNSSGDRARQALAGLELIGARRAAGVLLRAMDLFGPAGPSPSREARWSQTDRWTAADREALGRLDTEFQRYPDPISDLLERHCRSQRDAFGR